MDVSSKSKTQDHDDLYHRRKALCSSRYCPHRRGYTPTRRLHRRQGLPRHLGIRSPHHPSPARALRTQDIQSRRTPHPPAALSAHRSTDPQGESLRRRPDSPQTAEGDPLLLRACRANHRRYRRRKRRRAYLPLHLQLPRLPKALPAVMDLLPHRQGDSGGARQAQTRGAV